MEKLRKIFFDEAEHKYTDEYGNIYTSMTTCIKKYYEDFKKEEIAKACERIGRNSGHPKYLKYKGKTAYQLMQEWDAESERACKKGNNRHNYLENIINNANKYITSDKKYKGARIYTIQDIINDHDFGRIQLDYFEKSGLNEKYSNIYNTILALHNQGYSFYAEIGVFNENTLISGLVDLLALNHNTKIFIVIDWKTNKAEISHIAGYSEKDRNGNETGRFIETGEMFKPPIDNIPASMMHKYSLQVSGYATLVERFGFTNKGNIIYHIREDEEGKEYAKGLRALDLRLEANMMFYDFHNNNTIRTQKKLFHE